MQDDREFYQENKEKIKARSRERYHCPEVKARKREQGSQYYQKNKEKIKARSKKHYEGHKEEKRAYSRKNKKKIKAQMKAWREERRDRVHIHYGGGSSPMCMCCGETTYEFLTIDHVNGRKKGDKRSGGQLYGWLIKNNFPPGFQVLCFNCNHAKGMFGVCPHNKRGVENV